MINKDYIPKARKLNNFNLETYFGFVPVDYIESKEFKTSYNKLVEIAKQHISQKQFKISKSDRNIWVVHPSCEEIDNGKRPKQIRRLLDYIKKNHDGYRTILISDAIDYIINDCIFVEVGLFDGVILTENNQGKPLELSDLNQFKDAEKNLVGGCYVGMCLDVFIEILEEMIPDKKVMVIKRWSYDTKYLTLGKRVCKIFYSLAPQHQNKENIFLPRGTLG